MTVTPERGYGIRPRQAARHEILHAFSDHRRVREVFSPPEPVDLRTGIRRMAEWVRARGPATPVVFDDIEVDLNLPEGWR